MVTMYKIELIRKPTEDDWMWCKTCTLNTVGKTSTNLPTSEWKKKLIASEHSPLREIMFGFRMIIPYWVSVHFVRHHIGVNHYVQTQRSDRQDQYDRNKASQDTLVSHIMSINLQELVHMSHKRLCAQASPETRLVMAQLCDLALEAVPELEGFLVPLCKYRNGKCTEFFPCNK